MKLLLVHYKKYYSQGNSIMMRKNHIYSIAAITCLFMLNMHAMEVSPEDTNLIESTLNAVQSVLVHGWKYVYGAVQGGDVQPQTVSQASVVASQIVTQAPPVVQAGVTTATELASTTVGGALSAPIPVMPIATRFAFFEKSLPFSKTKFVALTVATGFVVWTIYKSFCVLSKKTAKKTR
jgi:hypothetical protein